jgi:restriction endonuclease S subunit
MASLKLNPHWAKLPLFDRKGWKRLPFGAFAESVNERVDPSEAAEEIYVGLEHLDSQDLHIRRWGKGSDVIGTKLRFQKGDLIFGRRRAYQRKLAVAEFDGICSAHAMVVRAKSAMVLPEFLPFLMMSDRFMKRAVEISVGSLSPTINWKTLKLEEFDLPLLHQQRCIAEVLSAMEETLQFSSKLQSDLSAAKDIYFDNELQKSTKTEPETLRTLGDALLSIVAGKSPKTSGNPASDSEYGVLKVSAAGDGMFCETENKALLDSADFVPAFEVKPGMILVTRCNALLSGIGRACLVEKTRPRLMLSDKTLHLVTNSDVIDKNFLLQGLRREPYRGFVERSANGTEAKNISQSQLRAAPFWLPNLKKQYAIAEQLSSFDSTLRSASNSYHAIFDLRGFFTNTVVS